VLSSRDEGHPRPYISGAALANLAIVMSFIVIASLLLTMTWVDSRGVRSDISNGITPQMVAVDDDLAALPVLDRTGRESERVALAVLPIAVALGRIADASTAAARDMAGARDDMASTRDSVAGIDTSVAALRASLESLAPVLVEIAAGTGDIREHLSGAQRRTAQAAAALAGALNRLHGVTTDTGTLARLSAQIEAVLKRIEGHGASAAAAPVLRCPSEPRACTR
jgi:hypothetical protein